MKKTASALLAAILCALLLPACGEKTAPESASELPSDPAPQSASSGEKEPASGLPISDGSLTLSWFVPLYNSNVIQSADDQYCWQEIQARTGIDIEFIHPPVGSENDTFNVRIASRDFPDIITWQWINFAGGPGKAITDEIIVDLRQYEEYIPNYRAIIDSIPTAQPNSTLDDGAIYGFIHAVPDPIINATGGFMIRNDWLETLNLEVPTNIPEWYEVLTAFKNGDPNGNGEADEIPYIASSGMGEILNFSTAYKVRSGYYPDPEQDGKIAYGPIQPKFKEFLAEMNKWYSEGLIDPEFPTNARKNIDEKMTSGIAGAFVGAIGSQLGSYNLTGPETTPGYELIGVNSPQTGDGISYTVYDSILQGIGNQCSAISTANEHPVESVRLIDYLYGDEGRTLLNWGKEGESYEIVDGKPQYTDLIMNNPDGLTKLDAVASYAVPIYGYFSAFYLDSYSAINLSSPQQEEAAAKWSAEDTGMCMPVLFSTEEEGDIISKKGADINTYTSEMLMKFIIGQEPLDKFDEYVDNVKQMGVDEVISIYQAMYDRYLAKTK